MENNTEVYDGAFVTKYPDRPIWYFSDTGEWWMETGTPREVATVLHPRIDGIHVTNAYDVLPPEFIAHLQAHSDLKPR